MLLGMHAFSEMKSCSSYECFKSTLAYQYLTNRSVLHYYTFIKYNLQSPPPKEYIYNLFNAGIIKGPIMNETNIMICNMCTYFQSTINLQVNRNLHKY